MFCIPNGRPAKSTHYEVQVQVQVAFVLSAKEKTDHEFPNPSIAPRFPVELIEGTESASELTQKLRNDALTHF